MPHQKQIHGLMRKVPKNSFVPFSPRITLDIANQCPSSQDCVRQLGPTESATPKKWGRAVTPFWLEAELASLTHPKKQPVAKKRFLDTLGCFCRRRFDHLCRFLLTRTNGPKFGIDIRNSLLFGWVLISSPPCQIGIDGQRETDMAQHLSSPNYKKSRK
jgi:hypothetical protein